MDFKREYNDDILILAVNLKRATFLEANSFNDILVDEIGKGYRRFIVDLSSCNSVDPVFVGVLILTLKKLASLKGNLKIVIPEIGFNLEKSTMYSLRLFETYKTKNGALESFKMSINSRSGNRNQITTIPSFKASFGI